MYQSIVMLGSSGFDVESAFTHQTRAQRCATIVLFVLNVVGLLAGTTMLIFSVMLASKHVSIAGSAIGAAVAGGLLVVVSILGFLGALREYRGRSGKSYLLVVRHLASPDRPFSHRQSLVAPQYFYSALLMTGLVIFFSVGAIAFQASRRFRTQQGEGGERCSSCLINALTAPTHQDTIDRYMEDHWDDIKADFPEYRHLVRRAPTNAGFL